MSISILTGDCLDVLAGMGPESFACAVTSPPYYGLRDYGVDGQIGLEQTPDEYVAKLVAVFREVRRVLRDDGTLWLNLGDSYNTPNNRRDASAYVSGGKKRLLDQEPNRRSSQRYDHSLKTKDLLGIPWLVAFALRADGWYLRSDIIWAKPNPMPESVRDRPTKAHEYVFLLTKSGSTKLYRARDTREWNERPDLSETVPAPTADNPDRRLPRWLGFDYFYDADAIAEPAAYLQPNSPQSIKSPHGQGFTRRAKGNAKTFRGGVYTGGKSFDNDGEMERDSHGNAPNETGTRNVRSVWTIATCPFPEAHFATFPPELAERCIKAGSRPGDAVLDPFGGAGTTGLVADRLGRDATLIEINPAYAEMARRRFEADAGMFAEVA